MRPLFLALPVALFGSSAGAYEGFGATTRGGADGQEVVVTSLADSGPGTLREALSGDNRRVVFAVGGTIRPRSGLQVVGRGAITIDGATAPPPGITIAGAVLYIRNSHDIIVSHLRVRGSADNTDNVSLYDGAHHVVIDHCSISDGGDENLSITENVTDVTVSYCILGETRRDSYARKTKGTLIANFNAGPVDRVSLHHNLYRNFFQRSPQVSTAGLVDIRNNVVRDWGYYGIRVRAGAMGNLIGNVFASATSPEAAVVLGEAPGPWHIAGNRGPAGRDVNLLSTRPDAYAAAPVTTDAAATAEARVLGCAGAMPRDDIDTALAGEAAADCPAPGTAGDGGQGVVDGGGEGVADGPAAPGESAPGGCGCRVTARGDGAPWPLLLLGLLLRRRHRRARSG